MLAAAPASASSLPVVYGGFGLHSNFVHPKVRPTLIAGLVQDGSQWLTTRSWRRWSSTSAMATGKLHYRSCWGSCMRFKTVRASISLWRVRIHRGTRYFTRLRYRYRLGGKRYVVTRSFHGKADLPPWIG